MGQEGHGLLVSFLKMWVPHDISPLGSFGSSAMLMVKGRAEQAQGKKHTQCTIKAALGTRLKPDECGHEVE